MFVRPPSREEQRARLEARGTDDPEQIERRLGRGRGRGAHGATEFDAVVVNDDVDRAVGRGRCYPGRRRAAATELVIPQVSPFLRRSGDLPPWPSAARR